MRSEEDVQQVLSLIRRGANDCEISRRTGIPRTTVLAWRHGRLPRATERAGGGLLRVCVRCGHIDHAYDSVPATAYAYVLGLYLGDGCLAAHPRGVYRLSVYLDARYQSIIEECAWNVLAVMRGSRVSIAYPSQHGGCAEVRSYSKQWLCLFPQHGPGRKHMRPIKLARWQQTIVNAKPECLLRGLIHSDGARFLNTVRSHGKVYRYPRYTFSNASGDIRRIFCDACDRVGVEWRQMNARNISVARRESVTLMDQFIGPKA